MVQLVTQYAAVTRQTPAAKSHPSGSNKLHLVPLERLCNLVATHPAAVGVQWSNHVSGAITSSKSDSAVGISGEPAQHSPNMPGPCKQVARRGPSQLARVI